MKKRKAGADCTRDGDALPLATAGIAPAGRALPADGKNQSLVATAFNLPDLTSVSKSKTEIDRQVKALIAAEDQRAVERAFLELMPTDDDDFATATADKPMKFIKKLDDIDSKERVKINAAHQYAAATIMSIRCERRRKIPPRFLQEIDQELLTIFDESDDALPTATGSLKEAQSRGRTLYNDCMKRAESLPIDEFNIRSVVAKGEFHRLANGQGFKKREITWLRKS